MMASSSPHAFPRAPRSKRVRDIALFTLLGVMVLAGLFVLAASTGWDETIIAIKRLDVLAIITLLALSLLNYGLRGLRWHLFARTLGLPLGVLANLRHFIGGLAMTITPGRVGELVRMRWIRRETGWKFERTAPLIIIDRAADLTAMALLMAAAILLAATKIEGAFLVAILAIGVAAVATRTALLRVLADAAFSLTGRFPRVFVRIRRAARALSAFGAPGLFLAATSLGLLGWFAEGVAMHLLLQWMGADIGLWAAVAIFVFATLAGGLTGSPGGLGGAEATMVVLLIAQGVPASIAVPTTLVIRVTTLWFAIALGAIVFPFAEKHAGKGQDALEN